MSAIEQPIAALHDPEEAAFTFAGFRLEPDGTLYRGQMVIHLPPRELGALRMLLAHAGQVVTPQQLRHALWGDVHVTADSIPKCLSSLRGRLAPEDCVQTVYKRGYRFTADVKRHNPAAGNALPRLAVMPFETAKGFPEHIALGVVEAAVDRIVNMRPTLVSMLARDSVFTLARGGCTAQQVGRQLSADLVLTGALHALPTQFRLRAAMVRVDDGTEVWVEDLLAERDRTGALESALVDRLVFRLASGAVPGDWAAEPPKLENGAKRREAYENYLRGRYECQTLERHRMQDGIQHLVRATEIDPSLISAQVDLAYSCCVQSLYGFMAPSVAAENVRRAAHTVPRSSELAEAILPACGWVSFHFDRDLKAAAAAYANSAHLPHDSRTSRLRVMFALSRHRFEEAVALMHAALEEDPFSPLLHARLAWAQYLAGEIDQSVERIRRTLSLFPGSEWTVLYGAIILAFAGDAALSVKLASEFADRHPYFDIASAVQAYALARAGLADKARTVLERLQWLSRERFVLRSFNAAAYVALGDHASALAELRAANENRCPWFFQMLADPRLKPLSGCQEFGRARALLADMDSAAAAEPKRSNGAVPALESAQLNR